MAQPLNSTAYGHFKFNPEEEDFVYSDVDRPGDEGRFDMAEIYYDYYLNDQRRYDNPEGWDSADEYWYGPNNYPTGIRPTIYQEQPITATDYYSVEDWEDWEMEEEYHRSWSRAVSPCSSRASDAWEHLATRMLNIECRDLNT
jgi:hypothetical protein